MENLKVISVRMSPSTIEKVDKLAVSLFNWERSTIINNIVTAIVNNADENDIYDLVWYVPHGSQKLKISVEVSNL